jgi:UDP-glucose 4-epimerase
LFGALGSLWLGTTVITRHEGFSYLYTTSRWALKQSSMTQKILVTGGAGYIGSHTSLALLEAGFKVVVIDNLCNSSSESLKRVQEVSGKPLLFLKGDIRDRAFLQQVFAQYEINAVLHFAGFKAVGESVQNPLAYYRTNVDGTIALCEAMAAAKVFTMIFSSSCTVYGEPRKIPVAENQPTGQPSNPYGRSKLMSEQILMDLYASDSRWKIALLRYFNPIGAHESGLIGEDPNGIPNNLMPYITQVAVGRLKQLRVFGNDYSTPDGTGVRDYIHVMDLVEGHLAALIALNDLRGVHIWNLGTGVGYSVLQIVGAFEAASHRKVPYEFAPRRAGDLAEIYADPQKAKTELGWVAKRDLLTMVADAWRWQCMNPRGFAVTQHQDLA